MKPNNLFRIFFAFTDLFAINLLNLILLQHLNKTAINYYDYTVFCIFNNMAWLLCSYSVAIYTNNKMLNFNRLFKRTFAAALFYLQLIFTFGLFVPSGGNIYMLYSASGFFIFLIISRLFFAIITSYLYKQEYYHKKIAFVGYNNLSKQLITHFQDSNKTTLITGFFDNDNTISDSSFPILGKINDCITYARQNKITEIYSTLSPKTYPFLYELAEAAETSFIRFKFIPDLSEFQPHNYHIDFIDDTPVLSLRREPLESIPSRIKKRVFDVVLSSLIIVFILSWLIPILAIAILLDSKGPVFFVQMRTGKNNIPFNCFKLRTLRVNDDADKLQVTRGDNRITRVGRFLRKTNLDELPQFFNVLLGHMSIVGSRPHMLKHTEEYSKMLSNYMVRHFLKPGVTGWAQINGYRGEIKQPDQLKKRVEHDIWYLENWNIWLDFKIVYLTFRSTLKGDKNAF
ncbi:MAG: Undecaprenyl-phosphate glucose phosphotransferase [Mucilaginibacter sp.]|nr:Undecaprenyl-phosphate glucose phosphotransferase [Mucilaginibacter sp.]